MTNPVKRFFLFSSGAAGAILKKPGCEVEHNKFAGIGATIFFTAALASLSGGYAMYTVFRDQRLALAFGLFWGVIIFNLDRFIVSSIRKRKPPANASLAGHAALKAEEFIRALPRLVLAVFISVVITRPIELKLFESEIQGQIAKDLTLERAEVEQRVRAEYADIAEAERETEQLRNRRVQLENELTRRIKVASGELEGWGGTARPGAGPEYMQRQAEKQQAERELAAFNKQYAPAIEASEKRVEARKQERDERVAAAKRAVDDSPGLLKRLEAYTALTTSHLSTLAASVFIIFLFISLETAPIFVKLFSSRGPYDDYLDAAEHEVYAKRQKEISDLNDDINTSVALSRQLNASHRKSQQQLSYDTLTALATFAPQELRDAQTEIARRFVELWRAAELARLNSAPPAYYAPPPPNPAAQSAATPPNPAVHGAATHAGAGIPNGNSSTP